MDTMSNDCPERETLSFEEDLLSSMWQIAALVLVLEHKGICTKQDLHNTIVELRKKNPAVPFAETAFPAAHLFYRTGDQVIDEILTVLNTNGLDAEQSLELLKQLERIIKMGVGRQTLH
jgi:hypothetical protein